MSEREKKIKYLNGYRWAVVNVKMLTERLEACNSKLYGTTSPVITDMPKGGLGIDTVDVLSDKIDTEQELYKRLKTALDMKAEIVGVIEQVNDPRCRMILEMKYFDFMTINEMAKQLGYSNNHISRLHNEAIDQLGWIEEKLAN